MTPQLGTAGQRTCEVRCTLPKATAQEPDSAKAPESKEDQDVPYKLFLTPARSTPHRDPWADVAPVSLGRPVADQGSRPCPHAPRRGRLQRLGVRQCGLRPAFRREMGWPG